MGGRLVKPIESNPLIWRALRGHSDSVGSTYEEGDPSNSADDLDETARPSTAPAGEPGLDPVELVVDGETFVVTRRPDSPRTIDFAWTSHPEGYGFGISTNFDWMPAQSELVERIRSFLAEIDPDIGYLSD